MKNLSPVPTEIVLLVNSFVEGELRRVENDRAEFFDADGMYRLHELAREVFASGWSSGHTSNMIETTKVRP